jgi:glycosyltransferase involved in cell wall biosynthesis
MTKKIPLISIVITCFNAQETIAKSIFSALNQSWKNKEILVIDDNSTDSSFQEITKIKNKYKSIKVFRNKQNMGAAYSRNLIAKKASGEFIAFFDDDDESSALRVLEQYLTLINCERKLESRIMACYCSGVRHYSNGYKYLLDAIGSKLSPPNGFPLIDHLLFNKKNKKFFFGAGVPACSLMIRTELFNKVGGFDPNMRRVEDADLAIRLAGHGCFFVGTKKRVFNQYSTIASDKTPKINFKNELFLIEKNKRYLKSINKYLYSKLWFRIRYYHFNKDIFLFLLTLFLFVLLFPLDGMKHILESFPRRFFHERKINKI